MLKHIPGETNSHLFYNHMYTASYIYFMHKTGSLNRQSYILTLQIKWTYFQYRWRNARVLASPPPVNEDLHRISYQNICTKSSCVRNISYTETFLF